MLNVTPRWLLENHHAILNHRVWWLLFGSVEKKYDNEVLWQCCAILV